MREGKNPAVGALEIASVSLQALSHELEASLPERGHPTFGEVVLPSTAGERAILQAAESVAAALKRDYLGTEHLLLAVLRDAESPAARVFSRHEITHETVAELVHTLNSGAARDLRSELEGEYGRICPGDEPDPFVDMLFLNPRFVLEELRQLSSGAGPLAVRQAMKTAARRQYGRP